MIANASQIAYHLRALADLLASPGFVADPMHAPVVPALLVTAAQLSAIYRRNVAEVEEWPDHLHDAMSAFGITTPLRIAAFLAQIGHESDRLRRTEENLNYTTAARIRVVWPSRFPSDLSATPYVRQPERLANFVYANRIGNGDIFSGDGWRYRGRGLIQLTGRANYRDASKALGVDLEAHPEQVELPKYAAATAAWFWQSRGINEMADARDFEAVSRRINGGLNGLADRLALFNAAQAVINT